MHIFREPDIRSRVVSPEMARSIQQTVDLYFPLARPYDPFRTITSALYGDGASVGMGIIANGDCRANRNDVTTLATLVVIPVGCLDLPDGLTINPMQAVS